MRGLIAAGLLLVAAVGHTQPDQEPVRDTAVEALEAPLYSPFIERYMLDELKQLRVDMSQLRVELTRQVVDREVAAVDRAVGYSYNTVTYFFYVIAGFSSLLVLIGWTSFRDIKAKVHSMASGEVARLIEEYEGRLNDIERQLHQKSLSIDENREEIELTQELHSLWLRASQESSQAAKIQLYDQILMLRPDDCEALTYKADAALELDEPQWAINLCHSALSIDKDNAHAFYQLACAHSLMNQLEEALRFFQEALQRSETYRDELERDSALEALRSYPPLVEMITATEKE